MSAHSSNFIRVRLHFAYAPPAVVDCRMCWLLVDLNACRVVADLESIIRDKFEFSRRSILSLFLEDCYLPHTESIYVVRDNDSLRVKVAYLSQVNGNSSSQEAVQENGRKRQRPTEEEEDEEEGPVENGVSVEWKKKKRKKERDVKQTSGDESGKKSPAKSTEKKKKKKEKKNKKAEEKAAVVTPKPAASPKTPAVKSSKAPQVAQAKTQNVSSSDSSSSEEDEPPKITAAQKPAAKKTAAQKPAPKTPSSTSAPKPTQTKPRPPTSSSETSSSSDDEAVDSRTKTKPPMSTAPKGSCSSSKSQPPPHALQASDGVAAPPRAKVAAASSSSSEEEIELVIRRPNHQPGRGVGGPSAWRGRGRGRDWRGGPGERGRGGGGRGDLRGQSGTFEFSYNGAKGASYQTDSLSNVSVVLKHDEGRAPKKDYSAMPLLAAPPQAGQFIAFKLLELTENYTPEVSNYKEGRIVSFDHVTKQIELELQNAFQPAAEPGKFDLVYQNADGSERVEYAVSRGSRVTERWDSLLEPRLII